MFPYPVATKMQDTKVVLSGGAAGQGMGINGVPAVQLKAFPNL
jgi:hypothetical protein